MEEGRARTAEGRKSEREDGVANNGSTDHSSDSEGEEEVTSGRHGGRRTAPRSKLGGELMRPGARVEERG